jgi:4-hydroxybenzoate polyprenyltransferase
MDTELLRLLIPLMLIAAGIFLRQTKNEKHQASKKYWKILLILGIIGFILKLINYLY